MTFNTATNKKEYYTSLNEMEKDHKRQDLIDDIKYIIQEIQLVMYDSWDVENIYLYGEVLDKGKFNVQDIELHIEMTKKMFENMVDSKYITGIKHINLTFDVDGVMWKKKDNMWIEGGNPPDYKILL